MISIKRKALLISPSFRACRGIKANRRRVRRNNNKCGYALISPLRSLTLTSVEMMEEKAWHDFECFIVIIGV